jgi:hypothetical protein
MKTLFTLACIAAMACTSAFAQSEAEMKAWMAYMTPGEQHKLLAADEGTWKEEMTFWMGPDAPPQKYTATAVYKMIMGGRYQESTTTGTMNGMPFEGRSIVGYNNASKRFEMHWHDNMSTGQMHLIAEPWDGKSKTIEYKGEVTDPMTSKPMKTRQVYTIVDDNTRKIEMFDSHNGKEFKSMEINMTRQK